MIMEFTSNANDSSQCTDILTVLQIKVAKELPAAEAMHQPANAPIVSRKMTRSDDCTSHRPGSGNTIKNIITLVCLGL